MQEFQASTNNKKKIKEIQGHNSSNNTAAIGSPNFGLPAINCVNDAAHAEEYDDLEGLDIPLPIATTSLRKEKSITFNI
jgi:hypothetical protein